MEKKKGWKPIYSVLVVVLAAGGLFLWQGWIIRAGWAIFRGGLTNPRAQRYLTDSDIEELKSRTYLTELNLSHHQISDISFLEGLTNLTVLNLQYNQISDISPLQGSTNLTHLFLCGNQISDLSPLEGLANLAHLSLTNNQISDISHLHGLTNLSVLTLRNNQVSQEDLDGLYHALPKITRSIQ